MECIILRFGSHLPIPPFHNSDTFIEREQFQPAGQLWFNSLIRVVAMPRRGVRARGAGVFTSPEGALLKKVWI